MANKMLEMTGKYLAGIGALNWGTSQFVNFNVLDLIPMGIIKTIAVATIAVSGGYVIYWTFKKKI